MTCAKKVVTCKIVLDNAKFMGENNCLTPQESCPRLPGEGYEKCKTICNQPGHAEIKALEAAKGFDLRGATAIIRGIHHVCKPCATALRDAGIVRIMIEVPQESNGLSDSLKGVFSDAPNHSQHG